MELPVIGQAADPDAIDLEPIVVPLCAYTLKREETIERFAFRPVMPAGAMAAVLRSAGPNGELPFNITLACLERCVMPDVVERWREFLDRDDLLIEPAVLGDVLNALLEHYSARPTRRRSASANGGPPARQTSRAAARSQASRSKRPRSS